MNARTEPAPAGSDAIARPPLVRELLLVAGLFLVYKLVTLANPLAAAVIGLSLLGERLQSGPAGVLLGLAGGGLASWGVVLLSRATPADGPADDDHPVAAVLALEPGSATAEPALVPRPHDPGPLTTATR